MIYPLAILFILLHGVDGREIIINAEQVTSLHSAHKDQPNKLITDDARCVVGLTDGKFITVAEDCWQVRRLLEGQK